MDWMWLTCLMWHTANFDKNLIIRFPPWNENELADVVVGPLNLVLHSSGKQLFAIWCCFKINLCNSKLMGLYLMESHFILLKYDAEALDPTYTLQWINNGSRVDLLRNRACFNIFSVLVTFCCRSPEPCHPQDGGIEPAFHTTVTDESITSVWPPG